MFSKLYAHVPQFLKSKWVIGTLALILLGGGYLVVKNSGKSAYQLITVTRGPITEIVSVTGNTTPVHSVSLGFGSSGTVQSIFAAIGNHVSTGALLAELNMSDLSAQLKQAQANVDAEQAKLEGLQAGARPEDIAAAQATYDKSAQDLANLYAGVSDTEADAYAKANDAVRTELSAFFSNADTGTPHLNFTTSNYQSQIDAQNGRVAAGAALDNWQTWLSGIQPSSPTASLDSAIQQGLAGLGDVRVFLQNVSVALNAANNVDATTLAAYKADLTAALTEVNTAIKNLNTASQGIASQKLTVAQLKAQLDLKKAGASQQDIAAQQAQLENAQAAVQSIQAKMQNAEIIAPQSGVVTQFDAKVGQIAAPGTALISIISDNAFEVDADVPETDIGKVAVGNNVTMTLDAFPNETFDGSVFYIDPAQTVTQGVVNYRVKINFAKADPRMKSGLTANIDIETKHKDDVLVLPQYAILQNDQGTFVEILQNGKVADMPVTLGIEDNKGNAEVATGVTEGEQVLNIGLKQ